MEIAPQQRIHRVGIGLRTELERIVVAELGDMPWRDDDAVDAGLPLINLSGGEEQRAGNHEVEKRFPQDRGQNAHGPLHRGRLTCGRMRRSGRGRACCLTHRHRIRPPKTRRGRTLLFRCPRLNPVIAEPGAMAARKPEQLFTL